MSVKPRAALPPLRRRIDATSPGAPAATAPPKPAAPSYPFTFKWTKGVESFFEQNDIYVKNAFKIRGIHKFGAFLTLPEKVSVEPFSTMSGKAGFTTTGAFSYSHSSFGGRAQIGRYCSIAPGSRLMGLEHPLDRISTHTFTCRGYLQRWAKERFDVDLDTVPYAGTDRGPLVIEHDVWIGGSVLFRPGLRIGTGAVVAAGSVVVKDVPPFAIVGGNPAKIIRYRFAREMIERILHSQWWRYHLRDFAGLDMADPQAFLDGIEAKQAAGKIAPYHPARIDLGREIWKIRLAERQQPHVRAAGDWPNG